VVIGGLSTALTIYGISMLYGVTRARSTLSELGPALAASGYSVGVHRRV
jgi:NADH-quinone oxidoreductase subunit N